MNSPLSPLIHLIDAEAVCGGLSPLIGTVGLRVQVGRRRVSGKTGERREGLMDGAQKNPGDTNLVNLPGFL